MGMGGFLFFGEKDTVLIDEIARVHKVPKEYVEKHYKLMLEAIKNDIQD